MTPDHEKNYTTTFLIVNKIIMKFEKKHAGIVIIVLFLIVNSLATLRLMFSVLFPERILKGVVADYFKENLNKAVKFEDIYVDYDGTIVIKDFDVSITSDFNDNISLIKSEKAVINLRFFRLFTGVISVEGIDFHDSEITFVKKFGRSHLDSFLLVFDPDNFIKRTHKAYENFYIDFHGAKLHYRESLRAKQITLELYNINAGMNFDKENFSYSVSGRIKPFQSDVIRKGAFDCSGAVDIKNYGSYSHRLKIDNFDLTYLNEHILDHKLGDMALKGGISADLKLLKSKNVLYLKGAVETGSFSLVSLEKNFSIVSNENLNCDIDLAVNRSLNRYTLRHFKASDDVIALDASGTYVSNKTEDSLALKFKSNDIDLGDLSQYLTPLKDIEYSGTLRFDGDISLDFKNKKSGGMKAGALLENFTLSKNNKGTIEPIIGESRATVSLDDTSLVVDISAKPLRSDLSIKSRTDISGWIPFRSETAVTVSSKKMNLENLKHAAVYFADRLYASAYADKRNPLEVVPFLQRPLGRFMNQNAVDLTCGFNTVFYGKKSRFGNVTARAQLARGTLLVSDFQADGYDAKYRLSFQGYFNSDQPYVKLEGKIDDFDLGRFYTDSGLTGTLSGKARTEFSYEVSFARAGDILDNAKGHFNSYVGKGEMKNTPGQQALIRFLRGNGYDEGRVSEIAFEDMTISISEQGENFWFSNFGIRGDTMIFNAVGDYLYEGGINSNFNIIIRRDAAAVTVPVRLSGPALAPCLDAAGREKSHRYCF